MHINQQALVAVTPPSVILLSSCKRTVFLVVFVAIFSMLSSCSKNESDPLSAGKSQLRAFKTDIQVTGTMGSFLNGLELDTTTLSDFLAGKSAEYRMVWGKLKADYAYYHRGIHVYTNYNKPKSSAFANNPFDYQLEDSRLGVPPYENIIIRTDDNYKTHWSYMMYILDKESWNVTEAVHLFGGTIDPSDGSTYYPNGSFDYFYDTSYQPTDETAVTYLLRFVEPMN